jgi:alkyl hydroperoxide reductase subunit AhpC
LAGYQQKLEEFKKRGIHLLVGSAESLEHALETRDMLQLTIPIAYGLIQRDFSILTGAYYNREKQFLHASAYIIAPGGRVELAVYSSGSVGRLTADEAIDAIDYIMKSSQK